MGRDLIGKFGEGEEGDDRAVIGRGDGRRRGPAIGEMPGMGKIRGGRFLGLGGEIGIISGWRQGGKIVAGVDGKGMGRRKGGGWA